MDTRKRIRVTLPLDLLCQIWDTRTDPNQDLDSRIEELLFKGLQSKGIELCPLCNTPMEKHTGTYKSGYFTEKETFEFYLCPKCGADTRTGDEVF